MYITYEQIWNTTEDLFNQNLALASDAYKFFGGVSPQNEITTQDGLIIKSIKPHFEEKKGKEGTFQVTFKSSIKLINFTIRKVSGESREYHKYYLSIPGVMTGQGEGKVDLDEPDDMKHFVKYVRDWKLKNLLE